MVINVITLCSYCSDLISLKADLNYSINLPTPSCNSHPLPSSIMFFNLRLLGLTIDLHLSDCPDKLTPVNLFFIYFLLTVVVFRYFHTSRRSTRSFFLSIILSHLYTLPRAPYLQVSSNIFIYDECCLCENNLC